MTPEGSRIGFVSTRLSGTDGVSLETRKWVNVIEGLGHTCYFFAGESEWPQERSYIVAEAHFNHPDIKALNEDLFDDFKRSSKTSGKIHSLRFMLKEHLYQFVKGFGIDLLIVENALAIPMNIPLGLALTEFIAETVTPAIAHHHDFAWERARFKVSAASDYQMGAFPPILPSVRHVVINSYAARQLALRTGVRSTLIPNVMDFDHPPGDADEYTDDLRRELGIGDEEFMLLQPTRVVPRKRIELAIGLARRLGLPNKLVISHASGDEGDDYSVFLREQAELMGTELLFVADRVQHNRGLSPTGDKIYSLADVYRKADIVTYPSTIEGFGNAFLEALYYKQPIVISTYEIFRIDIQPKGFKVISFDNFINQATVDQTKEVLQDDSLRSEIVEHNYELGRRFYSYRALEAGLAALLHECLGLP